MKKILLIIAVPLVVICSALLALMLLINPNQFKPLIVEQVKTHTGFDLVMEGDIEWQFFPYIGFSIGQTELRNPNNAFRQTQILQLDSVAVDISVLPLFDKQLEIGNVTLNGANIFVHKLADGRSNLDFLVEPQPEDIKAETEVKHPRETAEVASVNADTPLSDWNILLAGITVQDASLTLLDQQTGSQLTLSSVNFTLSQFEFEQWTKMQFSAKGRSNSTSFSINASAEVQMSADLSAYQARDITVYANAKDSQQGLDVTKLQLTLDQFQFGHDNQMAIQLQAKLADMDVNIQQSALVKVDKALQALKLSQFKLNADVKGSRLPLSPLKLELDSNIDYALNQQQLAVQIKQLSVNELQFDGHVSAELAHSIPKLTLDIHSPQINVDQLLSQMSPAKSSMQAAPAVGASTGESESQEPDLSITRQLDISAKVAVDKLQANNAKLQNVLLLASVQRGVITLQKLSANLYQGSVLANATIDARKDIASYQVHKEVKGVQIQPLMQDVAQMNFVAGSGNINVDVKGKGLTEERIKQNLAGSVKINFTDGAIYGVNVAYLIRSNLAKFKGEKIAADDVRRTDFASLSSTLKLAKGVMKTNDFNLFSPLLRIRGNGQANYLTQTMDFKVQTSVVGSLKGQGGKDIDALKDVTIPLRVFNTWAQPKFELDTKALLQAQSSQKVKQKAEKEIDRGIDKLLGSDDSDNNKEVKDAAKKLFNKLF